MPETAAILGWTLQQEIPTPEDIGPMLVEGEQPVASFKTFRDSATFTTKRLIVRDAQGTAVAALCINTDVMIWKAVRAIAELMLPEESSTEHPPEEKFFPDIDELAQHLLARAIDACGAPVDLMQKRHKIAVVNDLKDGGFFMLKESVEMAAQALQVTRFTIYNYLNELGNEGRSR